MQRDNLATSVQEETKPSVGIEGQGATGDSGWQIVHAVLGEDQFALNDKGLYEVEISETQIKPITLISAPLRITADTRDTNGENWGRISTITDIQVIYVE